MIIIIIIASSDVMGRGTTKGSGMTELNLLAQLIGSMHTSKEFRLNLFPSEEDEEG